MSELYIIRWPRSISSVYAHGAILKYSQNKSVYYANEALSPGQIICTWTSASDYLLSGIAPTLPLLEAGAYYNLGLQFKADNDLPLQIRIDFFEVYGEKISSYSNTDYQFRFKVPKSTVSYKIHLVNLRHRWIEFDYFTLQKSEEKLVIAKEFNQHFDWVYAHPVQQQKMKQEVHVIINCGIKSILSLPLQEGLNYEQVFVYTDGQDIGKLIESLVQEFQVKQNYRITFKKGIGFYTLPEEIAKKLEEGLVLNQLFEVRMKNDKLDY